MLLTLNAKLDKLNPDAIDAIESKLDRLPPAIEMLEVKNDKIESKLDAFGDLSGQLTKFATLINGLVSTVNELKTNLVNARKEIASLETKLDRVETELAAAKEDRATKASEAAEERASLESKADAIEGKLDTGELIDNNDLTPGQGGVWFMGAKKQPKPSRLPKIIGH